MEESFMLPVEFNDRKYEFESFLEKRGYTWRIKVTLPTHVVYVEPDDSGDLRMISEEGYDKLKQADPGMLQAVVDAVRTAIG